MFSVVCAVSVIFIFFAVPETRGKSLEQISKELNNRYGSISKRFFVFLKKYFSCLLLISKKKLSFLMLYNVCCIVFLREIILIFSLLRSLKSGIRAYCKRLHCCNPLTGSPIKLPNYHRVQSTDSFNEIS